MANMAEGFERGRQQRISSVLIGQRKGSCAEVRSHLYVASDVGMISEEQFVSLNALGKRGVGRVVGGLRVAVEPRPR